jgi:glutathione S-transferase
MCQTIFRHHDLLFSSNLTLQHIINNQVHIMSNPSDDTAVEDQAKCKFYDMKVSNNSARVRLWTRIKNLGESVDTVILTHGDIESADYRKINPLKKVPALITDSGLGIFEASVILQYLEDKFVGTSPSLILGYPDDRARVNLIVRCHDLYIASPNCNQPNFSHTQGCMYLGHKPTKFTPARRTMQADIRAAKLAELHQQLVWLEAETKLPYLAGEQLTHADLTWFPTAVFMELLLPLVFEWTPVFHESAVSKSFPKLSKWFLGCLKNEHFVKTRNEIRGTLMKQAESGRFIDAKEDVASHPQYRWKYA